MPNRSESSREDNAAWAWGLKLGLGLGLETLYLADDERLHRKVALKFLPPAVAQDPHARARLMREAQAAGALDHPNIATVYEVGEWNGQLFIAMPYCEGETLRQRIERGPLPANEAARIAGQIAAGLAAARRAGIVHRDLKPANVMLTRDGPGEDRRSRARQDVLGDRGDRDPHDRPRRHGRHLAYMAPEQATGQDADARADIWALASRSTRCSRGDRVREHAPKPRSRGGAQGGEMIPTRPAATRTRPHMRRHTLGSGCRRRDSTR